MKRYKLIYSKNHKKTSYNKVSLASLLATPQTRSPAISLPEAPKSRYLADPQSRYPKSRNPANPPPRRPAVPPTSPPSSSPPHMHFPASFYANPNRCIDYQS